MSTPPISDHLLRLALILAMLLLCFGCAHTPHRWPPLESLPALERQDHPLFPEQAMEQLPSEEILALDDEMRAFVDRVLHSATTSTEKIRLLQYGIRNPGLLGLRYDAVSTASAKQAFH